ncbi:hypothetical protein F5Y13DRAFT_193982 [Hypoxylon sp. FL1857]|nr:hypothetical protein F5Y13DRAFT_193982 [Hypoxylon sp. FL1857]
MAARRVEQQVPAADQAVPAANDEVIPVIRIPIANPDQLDAVEAHVTQNIRDIIAYSQHLIHIYEQTRDDAWLHRRRLVVQAAVIRLEALAVHQTQCKNTLQQVLEQHELEIADVAPEAHANPGAPIGQGAPVAQEAPAVHEAPVAQDEPLNPGTPAVPQGANVGREDNARIVAREDDRRSPELQPYVDNRIAHTWRQDGKLRFTLRYNGPLNFSQPKLYLARPGQGGRWIVEGWRRRHGGHNVKSYAIRATSSNLRIIREAYSYLRVHKCDLTRQAARDRNLPLRRRLLDSWEDRRLIPRNHLFNNKLQVLVIPPGGNEQIPDEECQILFRDLDRNGREETRCPISGVKAEPEEIHDDDLVMWIEESTLRVLYYLYLDLQAAVASQHQPNFHIRRRR